MIVLNVTCTVWETDVVEPIGPTVGNVPWAELFEASRVVFGVKGPFWAAHELKYSALPARSPRQAKPSIIRFIFSFSPFENY
jgi:hypothetical protein